MGVGMTLEQSKVVVSAEPQVDARETVAITDGRLVPRSIDELFRLSDAMFKSNLFTGHNSPMSVMVAILKGMDVGFTPTQALEEVYVVKGKPSFSAKAILALIRRSNIVDPSVGVQIGISGEGPDMVASITSKRRDEPAAVTDTFSMQDAKVAGMNSDPWRKYPKRMLRWKVIALHADMQYPDVTVGNAAKEIIEDFPRNGESINQIVKDSTPTPTPAAEDTALQALGIGWDAADGGGQGGVEVEVEVPPKTKKRKSRAKPGAQPRSVLSLEEFANDPALRDGRD